MSVQVVVDVCVGVGVVVNNASLDCVAINALSDVPPGLCNCEGADMGNWVEGVWGGGP